MNFVGMHMCAFE